MPIKTYIVNDIGGRRNKFYFFGFIIIFYFFWMDVALFVNLQNFSPPSIETNILLNNLSDVKNYGLLNNTFKDNDLQPSSIFNPLSVKLIMVDHMTHYIHDILARFLVDTIQFTNIFPWISANLVSFIGLVLAVLASRLTLFDTLLNQQVGALLFEFRNFFDVLDGVIYRAKKRVELSFLHDSKYIQETTYISNYGSLGRNHFAIISSNYISGKLFIYFKGYNVDIISDILGGIVFIVAILVRYSRKPPRHYDVKMASENSRYFTSRQAKLVVISFGIRVFLTSALWDHYVHKYHVLLMVFSDNPTQRVITLTQK